MADAFPLNLLFRNTRFLQSALAIVYPFGREIQMTNAEQKEKGMFTILVPNMKSCLLHRTEITVSN